MTDFVLKSNENVTVAVGAVDSTGTPVTVTFDPGTVLATVSDAGALSVTVAADELSINVKALGPVTTADVVTVTGSVAGVALTLATLAVDVVPAPAVAITLTPGVVSTN